MTPDSCRLRIKFWGVRGSTPTPEAQNLGYGGNTTCIEIQGSDGERIIIDAGTGIRKLGFELAIDEPQKVNLFLTHFHWDHIQGLPFFAPLLKAGNQLSFHSFPTGKEIQTRLARQMSDPYFTLGFDRVGASREFLQIEGTLHQGELSITPFPLNHPQGACGYRIESRGAIVVIATDLEHGDVILDKTLIENSEGADVLVYDAQYTPEEYATRKGWGHSTYEAAAKVAADAKVKKLLLFHHDPTHDDTRMDLIANTAITKFENTAAARELDILIL